jgi:hypothetical protein
MSRILRKRLFFLTGLAVAGLVCPFLQGQASRVKAAAEHRQQPAGMFDLQLGKFYEESHRWKEAEEEYIQAGRVGAPPVKEEALAAIQRLKTRRTSDDESFEFDLAKVYEDEKKWKDAEEQYIAAGKAGSKLVRTQALEGVKRAHDHRYLEIWVEVFDRWLGYIGRFLGVILLLVILWRIWKVYRAIEVIPFDASTDDARKRLAFSLSSASEELPRILGPPRMGVIDSVPFIILPGLEGEFPDPAEDLEIGGTKLPLSNLIKLLRRPRVKVVGRWNVGALTGSANARVLRRRRYWFGYRESRFSSFSIPSSPGTQQDWQLTFFAYDVLIKAIFSWARD